MYTKLWFYLVLGWSAAVFSSENIWKYHLGLSETISWEIVQIISRLIKLNEWIIKIIQQNILNNTANEHSSLTKYTLSGSGGRYWRCLWDQVFLAVKRLFNIVFHFTSYFCVDVAACFVFCHQRLCDTRQLSCLQSCGFSFWLKYFSPAVADRVFNVWYLDTK